jgi:hypothetical protein
VTDEDGYAELAKDPDFQPRRRKYIVSRDQIEDGAEAVVLAHPNPGGGYTVIWEDAMDDFTTALRAIGFEVES